MKLITHNPYRVVGILANSTEKDILKQKNKIKRFGEVGKEISSEYDFSFLPVLQRSNSIVNKAFSNIEQNHNKVAHSLFWFTNLTPVDNTAIQHLIGGNKEKALEIWEKLTDGKEVNTKNVSAFNNVGTLYLLDESKEKQRQGIGVKIKLIESGSFKNFVDTVADETFTIDVNKQTEKFIDELLTELKSKYSIAQTIDLFSYCNNRAQRYISQKFTEEPIHNIEVQIEQAKNNRIKDKSNSHKFGTNLHKNTKKELSQLKSILGATNLQYKMLADNIAKEILQCSIDYFNENQELGKSIDYLAEAMMLAKLADGIAVNKITKDRIIDSINTLEEMKEQELNQAVELLKSIKEAYEQACRQIDKQVEELQYDIIPGFGGQAPMKIPKLNVSINWNKVEEMKRNSLAWDKVVDLIRQGIPPKHIEKIRISEKQTKISEFKSLVDFLFGKLNYSQKNKVKYICYWKSVTTNSQTTIRHTSSYKPTSTTNSNMNKKSWAEENPGCLIAIIIGAIILLINLIN